MKLVMIKQTDALLEEPAASTVRNWLFGFFKGATEIDEKAWRRFMRAMNEGAAGEYFQITVERQRVGWKHRKQMALEGAIFKTTERFTDKESFRLWTKVGAGFVTWAAGPKGGVFPVPKSINFNTCSEEEFAEYRDLVAVFLRSAHCHKYLWPGLTEQAGAEAMEAIIEPFERPYHEQANGAR